MTNIRIPVTPEEHRAREAQERQAERLLRAADANRQRSGGMPGEVSTVDLSSIQWPVLAYYGYDHAKETSQLAAHIAGTLSDVTLADFDIVRALGLYHDLGRVKDWRQEDPGHGQRSAEMAEAVMKRDPLIWDKKGLHAEVCRLIAVHSLYDPKKKAPPSDPRLLALWDAECLEAARFAPKRQEGLLIMQERFGWVQTQWARNTEHQRRWRSYRGW